jgi:hypothetical protein
MTMKITYLALLTGALALTACDRGADEEFGREVNDPRMETTTTRDPVTGAQRDTVTTGNTTTTTTTLPRDTYPTTTPQQQPMPQQQPQPMPQDSRIDNVN